MQRNKWAILGGSLAVILLLALGTWMYQNRNDNKDMILQQDPGLTSEEKSFFNSRIDQLEQNFEKDLSDEEKFQTHLSVGANYVLVGEYAKAKQSFEEASKLMPENVVPLKELLILAGKMNDRESAEKYSNRLIEIDPVNKELYIQMFSEIK
jgi:tetratricopeptide (TPR) repeat protein